MARGAGQRPPVASSSKLAGAWQAIRGSAFPAPSFEFSKSRRRSGRVQACVRFEQDPSHFDVAVHREIHQKVVLAVCILKYCGMRKTFGFAVPKDALDI